MKISTTMSSINDRTLRILNTNSVHLITISLLFIPFTFFTSIAAVKFSDSLTLKTLTTFLTFKTLGSLLVFISSTVAGVALITYSTHQALNRIPLTFISAFKSLSHSFVPLLSTFIAGFITLSFIFFFITFPPLFVTEAFNTLKLGFHVNPTVILTIAITIGVVTVLYLFVIWGSAAPISVLESKSGFTPLTESASQSTEFRIISCKIVMITGFMIVLSLAFYPVIHNAKPELKWNMIVQIGITYLYVSMFVLANVVANTVLYVHCKVASGEYTGNNTVMELGEFPKMFLCGGFTNMLWFCATVMWIISFITLVIM